MKYVKNSSVQGSQQRICQGWAKKKIYVYALSAALLLAALASTTARAQSPPITQLQYLQWVTQVSGASGQFSHNSGALDYIHWAQSQGLNPSGGWQPGAILTKAQLSLLLAQQFGLNQNNSGGDASRALRRGGIDMSGVGDQVSKEHLAGLIDQLAVVTILSSKNRPSTNIKNNDGRGGDDHREGGDGNHEGGGGDDHGEHHKVLMCHKGHTIRVSPKNVAAHLAHGDTLGKCHVTRHGHDRDDDDHEHGHGHEGHD